MPEMTPERIASLAQSAKERDPNPEPLDRDQPQELLSAMVLRPVGEVDHIGLVQGYEARGDGMLAVYCADEDIVYASGFWSCIRVHGEGLTKDAR